MECEDAIKRYENVVYRMLVDVLGYTDNPLEAAFVTPDGKMLHGQVAVGRKIVGFKATHYALMRIPEIEYAVRTVIETCNIQLDYTEFDDLDVFLYLSKCIRVRPEKFELDVTVYRKPTSAQINRLIEIAEVVKGATSIYGGPITWLFVDVVKFHGDRFELVAPIRDVLDHARYVFSRLRMYYV